ncbi:hypothetical protein HHI36_011421, partial [Cryptolaemus montrouzieri]
STDFIDGRKRVKQSEKPKEKFLSANKQTLQVQKFHKIPTILANNREYKSDEEKANIFAEHFKQGYQYDKDRNYDTETETTVESWYTDCFTDVQKEKNQCKLRKT